jgi:hypothetical protein
MSSPFVLYSNALPPITEGEYTLTVKVDVTVAPSPGVTEEDSNTASYPHSQKVLVAGPAAGLGAGDVVRVTPANGATGAFAGVVPSIVLARQTLPWEVAIDGQAATTPWLALVVLPRNQIKGPSSSPTGTKVHKLEDYLTPPGGYLVPQPSPAVLALWTATSPAPQLATIELSVAALCAALPSVQELPLLCHVRDTSQAADVGAATQAVPVTSTVLSNTPVPPGTSAPLVAHLVNLDGFVPGLWSAAPTQDIRLISLWSWTFVSDGTPADFASSMQSVVAGSFGSADGATQATVPSLLVPMPAPSIDAPGARLDDRHPHLELRTAQPFMPYSGPLRSMGTPRRTASDIGLAAAWQLGRLLLINNRVVFSAALDWIHAAITSTQVAFERSQLSRAMALSPDTPSRRTGGRRATQAMIGTQAAHALLPPASLRAPLPTRPSIRHERRALARHIAVRSMLEASTPAEGVGAAGPVPAALLDWVTSVRRLGSIPWPYLVPDQALVPNEGIRFILLDTTWTAQVIAGAFSIMSTTREGGGSVSDSLLARLAAQLAAAVPADLPVRSGFVLRSSIVADWPDLGVLAWGDSARTVPLNVTVTRRAPNLMFAVVDGLCQRIDLQLMPQGLGFSVPAGNASVGAYAAAQGVTTSSALALLLMNPASTKTRQSFVVGAVP